MKRSTTLILRERGLAIPRTAAARELLAHLGYYRLSFYTRPLEDTPARDGSVRFRRGANFSEVSALVSFDGGLRRVLSHGLEFVVTDFRSTLIHSVSNRYPADPVLVFQPLRCRSPLS